MSALPTQPQKQAVRTLPSYQVGHDPSGPIALATDWLDLDHAASARRAVVQLDPETHQIKIVGIVDEIYSKRTLATMDAEGARFLAAHLIRLAKQLEGRS